MPPPMGQPAQGGGAMPPPMGQQQPPPQQPMGGGVGGFGAPPMGGGGVPQAFADPEGGAYDGAAPPPMGGGVPPPGGFPTPPTGGRHVGAIAPPPGGMPNMPGGAGSTPQPAAPVQFFNPAAVPQRQPKAAGPAGAAADPNAAPTEQMANMSMRTGPAQAFTLGDLAAGPSAWNRQPGNPIPDAGGQSQPRYMQVSPRSVACVCVSPRSVACVCVCPLAAPPVARTLSSLRVRCRCSGPYSCPYPNSTYPNSTYPNSLRTLTLLTPTPYVP